MNRRQWGGAATFAFLFIWGTGSETDDARIRPRSPFRAQGILYEELLKCSCNASSQAMSGFVFFSAFLFWVVIVPALINRLYGYFGLIDVGPTSGKTINTARYPDTAILGFAFAAWMLWEGLVHPLPDQRMAWLSVVVLFAALGIITTIGSFQRWSWNEDYLERRGAFRSRRIYWRDVLQSGETPFGAFYIADRAGQRITWDRGTLAANAIFDAVERNCPRMRIRRPPSPPFPNHV